MDDTVADELVAIGLTSAKRIKIVLIMFLQWLLGTGSVNTTTRSDASNAMHTDQVRKNIEYHSIVSSWSGMKLFQLVSIKFLKCSYCLQG